MKDPVLPEHLIDVVIAADAVRRQSIGSPPVRFKPSQRAWIEPFFNSLGIAFGQVMAMLPWVLRKPFDVWICRKMGGHSAEENPELATRITETVEMARGLHEKTGQWPALLILTSHPETEGPLQWLRFELLAQGIQIADAVVEAQPVLFRHHPQCFLAIDPYALDTVSVPVGAFYAGWMYRIYLAWDRQASTQSWIQRHLLLRGSGYPGVVWRLLRRLRHDIPVLMVFPGGLPQNARLLYAAREFIHSLKPPRWPYPKRVAQKKLMGILSEAVNGMLPIMEGKFPKETADRIRALLTELGLPPTQVEKDLQEFTEEFRSPIPNRERLMRLLLGRLVKKGKPVILLAVSHRNDAPHVRVAPPMGLHDRSLRDAAPLAREFSSLLS